MKKKSTGKRVSHRLKSWLGKLGYGGHSREAVLVRLLGALHRNQFKRQWKYADNVPHFTNDRIQGYELVYGKNRNPYFFNPGAFVSEVIRPDDAILDISCGDGFITNSYFSCLCQHIDAFDIDPSAIRMAKRLNSHPKIDFQLRDAVRQPFPGTAYDVIVWNGAIGHFRSDDVNIVLAKIKAALRVGGIFAGSEALGREGHDHLQFFADEKELAKLFRPYFKHVWVRSAKYPISGGYIRTEAYWRCSDSLERHETGSWKPIE